MGVIRISSDDIAKLGVNIIVGTNERSRIVELVEDYISNKEKINIVGSIDDIPFEDMEVSYLEGKTRAFVKIQDGCNNYCSYCIIPYARETFAQRTRI